MISGGQIYGMLLCLRNVQELLADGKTPHETKIRGIFQSTNYSIWCTGGIPPKFRERQKLELINSEKKVFLGIFLGDASIEGVNLERSHSGC